MKSAAILWNIAARKTAFVSYAGGYGSNISPGYELFCCSPVSDTAR